MSDLKSAFLAAKVADYLPKLLSFVAAFEASFTSSDCVYGRSRFALSSGSTMRLRNECLVFGAPRTVTEDTVVGNVEFSSMRPASRSWDRWKVACILSLMALCRFSTSDGSAPLSWSNRDFSVVDTPEAISGYAVEEL